MPGPASPAPVRRAAALVAAEGAAVLVAGLAYAVAGVLGRPENRLHEELAAALAVLSGPLVLLVARGLRRCRPWARSPSVVLQLLLVPVGLGLLQGHVFAAGVPLVACGIAVLYALATPEARLALRDP